MPLLVIYPGTSLPRLRVARDNGRAEAYTPTERRCKGVGLGRTWPDAPPSFVRPERMP